MKYFWTLAALAAVAAAQDTSGIPECAVECIAEATAAETDCESGDYECSCIPENNNAIRVAATPCVIESCGAEVALNEVIPATEALCESLGDGGDDGGDDEEEPPTPSPSDEEEPPTPTPTDDDVPEEPEESEDSTVPPEEDDDDEESHVPVPPPTHSSNDTIPEPSHVETDGAATAGFMGVAAMVGLAALAL